MCSSDLFPSHDIRVAIVSHDDVFKGRYKKAHIVKKQETLKKYVTVNAIDDIFYCLPVNDKNYNLELLLKEAEEIGVTLHIMQPVLQKKPLHKSFFNKPFKYRFVTYQTTPKNYMCLKVKDMFSLLTILSKPKIGDTIWWLLCRTTMYSKVAIRKRIL